MGDLFSRCPADALARTNTGHRPPTNACRLCHLLPLSAWEQLNQSVCCGICGVFPRSCFFQTGIKSHQVRRFYLADLHVTQCRRNTRPQITIFGGRFGLALLVYILLKPAVYQVIQFHICIESKPAMHRLFKLDGLPLHLFFQLAPGQGGRRGEGAGRCDLLAVPIIPGRHPEQVGSGAVFILSLHDLSHSLAPPQ